MKRPKHNFPPRAYYRLDHAAELLGCSQDDFIHWAVHGYISVCIHADFVDGIGMMNCRYIETDEVSTVGAGPSEIAGYEMVPVEHPTEDGINQFYLTGWWELTNGSAERLEAAGKIEHGTNVALRLTDASAHDHDYGWHTPRIVLAKANQEITTKDLVITQTQFERLKTGQAATEPPHHDTVEEKPLSKQTENNLHAVVAGLARLYTKSDCSKPYEAAETILQAFALNGIETVKKDALASYILAGNERINK